MIKIHQWKTSIGNNPRLSRPSIKVLFKSRRRHTRWSCDWSSDVCSSDLSMRDGLQAPCRAVKPARFVVLREAWMPAVLVEVGYVTNRTEASRLSSAEYRQAAARAIAAGTLSYIRSVGAEHI